MTLNEAVLGLDRWPEISILAKATILLMMGLTAVRLAARSRAALRHVVLATTFAALIILPLIVFTVPGVAIYAPVSPATTSIGTAEVANSSGTAASVTPLPEHRRLPVPSWPTLARAIWLGGAILLFLSPMIDFWQLRRLRREALPSPELRALAQSIAREGGIGRPVEILTHEGVPAPITCGIWRPAIILPADAQKWSAADLRRALVHEFEHVRRCDWPIHLAARAVCACYWFHPLVWIVWRRLCLEAERACDDAVLQHAESTGYAEQLVSLARRMSAGRPHPALGMAHRSDLSVRVSAVLDGGRRRGRAGLPAVAGAMIVASFLVLAIAPVHVVAQSVQRRSGPLDRALFEAAADGELADITALLNAGANVNCKLQGDGSPLMAAAGKGHLAAVRLLLDRGADVNMPVSGDGNPLIVAARAGSTEVVALLLDRGASIDQVVPRDENALIQASGKGRLDVVKLLVARGANVNARAWVDEASGAPSGEWRTPLGMARKSGRLAVVAFLESVGARE